MQQAVTGEVRCVDLDLLLPGLDEPDVAIRHQHLDLQSTVARHDDDQQRFCASGDDAADHMDRELLHGAVDRRRELLKPWSSARP